MIKKFFIVLFPVLALLTGLVVISARRNYQKLIDSGEMTQEQVDYEIIHNPKNFVFTRLFNFADSYDDIVGTSLTERLSEFYVDFRGATEFTLPDDNNIIVFFRRQIRNTIFVPSLILVILNWSVDVVKWVSSAFIISP